MIIRPYDDTLLIVHCLITHTTDGIAAVLDVVGAGHVGVIVVEAAEVCFVAIVLCSTPKEGGAVEVVVAVVVIASGNG